MDPLFLLTTDGAVTRTIEVANVGSGGDPVEITTATIVQSDFTVNIEALPLEFTILSPAFPFSLAAGDSEDIVVEFNPTQTAFYGLGWDDDTPNWVVIGHDETSFTGDETRVATWGFGGVPGESLLFDSPQFQGPWEGEVEFPETLVDETSDYGGIFLGNHGPATATLTLVLDDPDGVFDLPDGLAYEINQPPDYGYGTFGGETELEIPVEFTPTAIGEFEAEITVNLTNGGFGDGLIYSVFGEGVGDPTAVVDWMMYK